MRYQYIGLHDLHQRYGNLPFLDQKIDHILGKPMASPIQRQRRAYANLAFLDLQRMTLTLTSKSNIETGLYERNYP